MKRIGWQAYGISVIISTNLYLVPCLLSETVTIYILQVFIKDIVFHHAGISWMIKTREQYDSAADEHFPCWCSGGSWYNTTIFPNLHGPIFEDFIVTPLQKIYEMMCGLHSYGRPNDKCSGAISFGGGKTTP